MKKILLLLIIATAGFYSCGQSQTHSTKDSVNDEISFRHPKLIKTIGNPGYGNVQCGIQDKAGNLWFGTTANGLYKYDGKSFRQFLITDGLNSNNIWSLLEDKDGKIWIGTEAGLCLYNNKTFAPIEIPLPKNLPPGNNRNTHEIFSMMQDKNGQLWFATIDGVYVYDGKSFTHFIIDESAMGYMSTNNNAEHILEDEAGNIWFGGRGNEGVYRYDGKSVTNLKLKELFQNGPKPKANNWAWPQLQDKDGNIWFAIGVGSTGMILQLRSGQVPNHLQVLRQAMA